MAVVHQSHLAAWNRCPAQLGYDLEQRQSTPNSATAYGTVIHHALHVLERYSDLDAAVQTFLYYWHPLNIEELSPPIPRDGWLPSHSYSALRTRGVHTLQRYADLIQNDQHELLALEYDFVVPLEGTPHYLAGTVDRLAARWKRRTLELCLDDFKSGRQKWNLRHNVQGHAYAYASTRPEFWQGYRVDDVDLSGEPVTYEAAGFDNQRAFELEERFAGAPRRFTWINLQRFKWVDGGTRGPIDYERLRLAVGMVVQSIEAGIFPLTIDGEVCTYCEHRNTCGGTGLPDDSHGEVQVVGA